MSEQDLSPQEIFREGCRSLGLTLSDEQEAQFRTVLTELIEWNQKINLTTIIEPKDIVVKHFLDSLTLTTVADFSKGGRLIDVGTGGGFPGIPLKIVFPELNVVLLDSVGKRLGYLDHLIHILGFTKITTLHARSEDAGRLPAYRDKFNFVTARAVARMSTLSELCIPLCKVGGLFLAMKGPDISKEITAAKSAVVQLGGTLRKVETLELPYEAGSRTITVIEKVKPTPATFPRKAGIPSRQPLGEPRSAK